MVKYLILLSALGTLGLGGALLYSHRLPSNGAGSAASAGAAEASPQARERFARAKVATIVDAQTNLQQTLTELKARNEVEQVRIVEQKLAQLSRDQRELERQVPSP